MFFHRTPRFVRQLYPSLVWRIPTDKSIIHLTFDDGPIPDLTPYILDTLGQYKIPATFFCVGENLKNNSEVALRAIEEGHRLANHTHNHLKGWKTSVDEYVTNVDQCQKELEALGISSKLMRPPYGQISRKQIAALKDRYQIIMWDTLSGDYSSKITPHDCLYNTIKATTKGSIVLFHDNLKAEKNVTYALPRFIEHFLAKGYSFERI